LDLAVDCWFQWTRGFLPYSGGWAEQPAAVIELIYLMEYTYKRWEKEQEGKR
jgi:hypothetical protein